MRIEKIYKIFALDISNGLERSIQDNSKFFHPFGFIYQLFVQSKKIAENSFE